ncbi:hypothetical protein B0I37DRAFT_408233 [Chaetomium sp. MPI-CAGE-AT-0009]|nr:hypothetical protein B0I37DRAFT_408233 [Chaetomium sp. MPI-CAGE-AT-0009]
MQALQRLSAAAALLHYALALPQAGITAVPSPVARVTVEAAGSSQTITPGPTVLINPESDTDTDAAPRAGPDIVPILLPIVAAVAVGVAVALCVLSWRRHGRVPLVGAVMGKLTDRASWSPTGRGAGGERNVFREEVERQERLR